MARKLKQFDPPSGKGGRKPTYPWSKWFDGNTWELVHGRDFHSDPKTMQNLIRRTASKAGHLISVYLVSDTKLVLSPRHRAAG